MDMSSLFPDGGVGSVLSSRPAPHISFKAGVLNREPASNRVTADPRKGVFQIVTSPEDQLLHLQWRERNQSSVEHDLILFSAETEMKVVSSAPSSARVYVLKWRGADNRMFFWMQERDPAGDARLIEQVNAILENGPDAQPLAQQNSTDDISIAPRSIWADAAVDAHEEEMIPIAAEGPTPVPMESENDDTSQGFQPISLEQMRAAIEQQTGLRSNPSATQEAPREQILTTPTVGDLLNPEVLSTALENPIVKGKIPELLDRLPEQDRSVEKITQLLRAPPLRAQAAALSNALRSGQADELIRSFELPASQSTFGLQAFLDALEKLEKKSNPSSK